MNFRERTIEKSLPGLVASICCESWRSFYGCSVLSFQPERNRQPHKMGREVALTDVDGSGC